MKNDLESATKQSKWDWFANCDICSETFHSRGRRKPFCGPIFQQPASACALLAKAFLKPSTLIFTFHNFEPTNMSKSAGKPYSSHLNRLVILGAIVGTLLALVLSAASAQSVTPTSGGQLSAVVVTGSRLPLTESGLAQSFTVVDQAAIRQMTPSSIEDVLRRIDGVYVDSAGKAGGFSSLYMRGAEQSHVLILIDGIKVNDSTTTRGSAYDLSGIDVQQVERIEVLRGPASAIHGGEALAGVVNIITKRTSTPGISGSAYAGLGQGSQDSVGGTLAFGSELLSAQVNLGRRRDGLGAADGSQSIETSAATLKIVPDKTFGAEVFTRQSARKSDAFPDDSGGPRLAVNRAFTSRDAIDRTYGVSAFFDVTPASRLQASATVFDRTEATANAFIAAGLRTPVPKYTNDSRFKRSTANASLTSQIRASTQLMVGMEYLVEEGGSTSLGDFFFRGRQVTLTSDLSRTSQSVFAESVIEISPGLSAQAGLRSDNMSQSAVGRQLSELGRQTTPHLGMVWQLAGRASTLKANYSEGFKPPSFFALGHPLVGNSALRPEKSSNTELIWLEPLDGGASSAQVSLFAISYQDLVDFDAKTFKTINRGTILVRGAEPSIKLKLSKQFVLEGGFTVLDIAEKDGLAPLRNRPKTKAVLSGAYQIDARSSMNSTLSYTGSFVDRSNPTGDIELPGFAVLNAAYSRDLGSKVRLNAALDNLLDVSYEQFAGFPAPGRQLRVELRAQF